MITHFIPALGIVENYPNIVIYRDHEDPYTFYYLNTRPRVTIDTETKKPVFDYMVIGRNIKREGSEGVQEGRLVMSVNLALTEDKNGKEGELTAVEKKVKNYIEGRNSTFLADLKHYYPDYDNRKYQNTRVETYRTRWFVKTIVRVENVPRQVNIKSLEFIDGTTSINLASSDFAGKFVHETKPTLFGDCNATIAVNLDAQESQILYQIFKPQDKKDEQVNLSAIVNYNLKYKTVVPLRAKASIDYSRIYSEFQKLKNEHAGMDTKFYGRYKLPSVIGDVTNSGYVYSNGADLYISKEDLENYLRNSDSSTQNIKIKIDDYIEGDSAKYEQIILDAVSKQMTSNVCDKLFEKVQPLSPSDIKDYDVATTGSKGSQSSTDAEGKEKKRNVVYDVAYKLKSDINTSVNDSYAITIDKNQVIDYEANPNGSLELILKNDVKGIDLSSLVRELDASDIYFQEMLVPIKVDNTNFGRDIAMISVRVIYKDKSGNVKLDRVFNFDEEDPDAKTFRVIMSRNDKGELIDKFYYQTRIRYRGFDVYGRNVKEEDKWTGVKEAEGVGEGIYVPYSDMRNLCVNCEAGDVAWDVIDKLAVEFKYKDAPDKEGATKLMYLTPDKPSDTWNCYMYNENSDHFVYRIHYFYQDGTDDWSQTFEGTSSTKNLVVNDKLSGIFTTKFDINFKKSIERVRVIVRCQGKEQDSGWIYQPDTWMWRMRLKEDGKMSYQYKYQYYLVNGDDSMKGIDWTAPQTMDTESNEQTVEINLSMGQISLIIDGESIDWNLWSRVYLHFRYDDDAHNLHYDDDKIPPLKLSSSKNEETVVIPVIDESIRPRIFAEYIPIVGDEVISSDEATAGKIVMLPHNAPPKVNPATAAAAQPDSSGAAPNAAPTPEAAPAPEPEPEPVIKDLSLTFSAASVDWSKWMSIYIHIRYDDEENDIHVNDQTMPVMKLKQGADEKNFTFLVKNSAILPRITADYMTTDGEIVSSDPTPVTGPIVALPDDVPPKG